MQTTVIMEIKKAITDWAKTHQPDMPKSIRIPREYELRMMELTANDVGSDLAQQLVVGGPRAAFPTLFGIKIEWDASQFGVS